ncbi:hypothetical protein BLNAU_1379 [Blattamonas nauphoetae]|uniref:Uncharacterized protein n=1 Tax=Blattamonas nauphoetae TaxID=2049346 RepID=A0ABQ9YJ86_9EUKA|nr:hypothetical protein BLNAU_1379 [Blattamonas nauphoetae]
MSYHPQTPSNSSNPSSTTSPLLSTTSPPTPTSSPPPNNSFATKSTFDHTTVSFFSFMTWPTPSSATCARKYSSFCRSTQPASSSTTRPSPSQPTPTLSHACPSTSPHTKPILPPISRI